MVVVVVVVALVVIFVYNSGKKKKEKEVGEKWQPNGCSFSHLKLELFPSKLEDCHCTRSGKKFCYFFFITLLFAEAADISLGDWLASVRSQKEKNNCRTFLE